jgi:hypothetical protein
MTDAEKIKALRKALLGLAMHCVRRGYASDLEPFMTQAGETLDSTMDDPSPRPAPSDGAPSREGDAK